MNSAQASLSRHQSRLLLAYFCLFPWLYWPGTHEIYALRESVFFGLTGLFILSSALSKYRLPINTNPIDISLILIFIIRVISWITFGLQTNFEQALLGIHSLMFELSILLFYLQIRRLRLSDHFNNTLASYFIGSCLLICLLSPFAAPISANAEQGRWQALFFHPNFLGIFSVIMLALAPKIKLHWQLSGIALVLMSGSRVALGLLLILMILRLNFKAVFSISVIGILLLGWRASHHPVESFRLTGTEAIEMRSEIYQGTLKTIRDNPLGTGPGIFGPKVHEHLGMRFHELFPDPHKHSIYKAHNSFLEWSAESGILITLLLICLIFLITKIPSNNSKTALSLLFLGSMVSVVLNYPSGLILATFLLASTIQKSLPKGKELIGLESERKSELTSLLVRFLSPAILGSVFIAYSFVVMQAHNSLPKVIKSLEKGMIDLAYLELEKHKSNPCLELEKLYYQFRITQLLANNDQITNFFRENFAAWVDVSYQLSLMHLQQGQTNLALKHVERSIDFHPLWPKNYHLKALILKRLGHHSRSQKAKQTALKLETYKINFRENVYSN